jgi:hypothetical protein
MYFYTSQEEHDMKHDGRDTFKTHKSFGKEGDHLEDTEVNGNIILKQIFRKWDGGRHVLD